MKKTVAFALLLAAVQQKKQADAYQLPKAGEPPMRSLPPTLGDGEKPFSDITFSVQDGEIRLASTNTNNNDIDGNVIPEVPQVIDTNDASGADGNEPNIDSPEVKIPEIADEPPVAAKPVLLLPDGMEPDTEVETGKPKSSSLSYNDMMKKMAQEYVPKEYQEIITSSIDVDNLDIDAEVLMENKMNQEDHHDKEYEQPDEDIATVLTGMFSTVVDMETKENTETENIQAEMMMSAIYSAIYEQSDEDTMTAMTNMVAGITQQNGNEFNKEDLDKLVMGMEKAMEEKDIEKLDMDNMMMSKEMMNFAAMAGIPITLNEENIDELVKCISSAAVSGTIALPPGIEIPENINFSAIEKELTQLLSSGTESLSMEEFMGMVDGKFTPEQKSAMQVQMLSTSAHIALQDAGYEINEEVIDKIFKYLNENYDGPEINWIEVQEMIKGMMGDDGEISMEEIMVLLESELTEEQYLYVEDILKKALPVLSNDGDFTFDEQSKADFIKFLNTLNIEGVDMLAFQDSVNALTTFSLAGNDLSMEDIMIAINNMDSITDEEKEAIAIAVQTYGSISHEDVLKLIHVLQNGETENLPEDVDYTKISEELILYLDNNLKEGQTQVPIKDILEIFKQNLTPEQFQELITNYLIGNVLPEMEYILLENEQLFKFLEENDITFEDIDSKEEVQALILEKMNEIDVTVDDVAQMTMEDIIDLMHEKLTPEQVTVLQAELGKFVYLSQLPAELTVDEFMTIMKTSADQISQAKKDVNMDAIFMQLDALKGQEVTMAQIKSMAKENLTTEQMTFVENELSKYRTQILSRSDDITFDSKEIMQIVEFVRTNSNNDDIDWEKVSKAIIGKSQVTGKISAEKILQIIHHESGMNSENFAAIEKQMGNYLLLDQASNMKIDEESLPNIIDYLSEKAEDSVFENIDFDEFEAKCLEKMAEGGDFTIEDIMELMMSETKAKLLGDMEGMHEYLLSILYENPELVYEYHEKKAQYDAYKNGGNVVPPLNGPNGKPEFNKEELLSKMNDMPTNLRGSRPITSDKPPRPTSDKPPRPEQSADGDKAELADEKPVERKPDAELQEPGNNLDDRKSIKRAQPVDESNSAGDLEQKTRIVAMFGGFLIIFVAMFMCASRMYSSYSLTKYQDMTDDDEEMQMDDTYNNKKKFTEKTSSRKEEKKNLDSQSQAPPTAQGYVVN